MLKSLRSYAIHSIFLTVQGEGLHSGRKAVFVRFSGCNVWNGLDIDRERDAANNSACARICDTEFKGLDLKHGGGMMDPETVAKRALEAWGHASDGCTPFVVLTGGEPSLQVDHQLVRSLKAVGFYVAIETNGSRELPGTLDWVTLSPKLPMPVVPRRYDELKLLSIFLNDVDRVWAIDATFRYVQPTDLDGLHGPLSQAERAKCLDFVRNNPSWRIGAQNHKLWCVP